MSNPRSPQPQTHVVTQEPAWTLLGPGTIIHGDLLSAGDLIIHGRVEGMVFADGTVHIAADGSVDGGVRARRVLIDGICRGRIEATEQVTIASRALVQADVACNAVMVDPDARFFGSQESTPRRGHPKPEPFQTHSGQA